MREMDQLDIVKKWTGYWLDQGVPYLESRSGYTHGIISVTDRYKNVVELKSAVRNLCYCLDETALSFFELGHKKDIDEFRRIMKVWTDIGYEDAYPNSRNSGIDGFAQYVEQHGNLLDWHPKIFLQTDENFIYLVSDPFTSVVRTVTEDQYELISTRGYVDSLMEYFFGVDKTLWSWHLDESRYDGKHHSMWRFSKSQRSNGMMNRRIDHPELITV